MEAVTSQCVVLNEKNEREYSLPSFRQEGIPKDTRYSLLAGCPEKADDLSSSFKMPKKADELLLGLLCERQDLCFPDFEVEDEGEEYQPGNPENFIEGCTYMDLISINGTLDLKSGCKKGNDDVSEDLDEDCWSIAVNFEKEDLGSRPGSWFHTFVDLALGKIDTGQNLRYCVQVFSALFGFCWEVARSMFGYKEVFYY